MVTIVTGIPASGKTTYCADKENISFDTWVKDFTGIHDVEKAAEVFSSNYKVNCALFAEYVLKAYKDVLYVDICLVKATDRQLLVSNLHNLGIRKIRCDYMLCALYTAIERNKTRSVPISTDTMYNSFVMQEYPTTHEGFLEVNFIVS